MATNGDERQQARERQRRHREREAAGLPVVHCGARTRAGAPCRRPAGAGTDHPGHGACSRHGGSTPTHRAMAAREQAAAEVRVMLGSQLDIDGDEALRTAMGIAAANVAVFQARLAEMQDAPFDGRMLDLYRLQIDAVDRLGRWGKAAIDVDLPGRQARIAERQAGQITTAFERAVSQRGMPPAEVAALVSDFADELLVLEHTSVDALDDGLSQSDSWAKDQEEQPKP